MEASCANSKCDHEFDCNWDNYRQEVVCPKCGTKQTIDYDEWYDKDFNNCYDFFFMVGYDNIKEELLDQSVRKAVKQASRDADEQALASG